jgi:hypothetical protein
MDGEVEVPPEFFMSPEEVAERRKEAPPPEPAAAPSAAAEAVMAGAVAPPRLDVEEKGDPVPNARGAPTAASESDEDEDSNASDAETDEQWRARRDRLNLRADPVIMRVFDSLKRACARAVRWASLAACSCHARQRRGRTDHPNALRSRVPGSTTPTRVPQTRGMRARAARVCVRRSPAQWR